MRYSRSHAQSLCPCVRNLCLRAPPFRRSRNAAALSQHFRLRPLPASRRVAVDSDHSPQRTLANVVPRSIPARPSTLPSAPKIMWIMNLHALRRLALSLDLLGQRPQLKRRPFCQSSDLFNAVQNGRSHTISSERASSEHLHSNRSEIQRHERSDADLCRSLLRVAASRAAILGTRIVARCCHCKASRCAINMMDLSGIDDVTADTLPTDGTATAKRAMQHITYVRHTQRRVEAAGHAYHST